MPTFGSPVQQKEVTLSEAVSKVVNLADMLSARLRSTITGPVPPTPPVEKGSNQANSLRELRDRLLSVASLLEDSRQFVEMEIAGVLSNGISPEPR